MKEAIARAVGVFSLVPVQVSCHNTLAMKRTILSFSGNWIPALALAAMIASTNAAENPWLGAWALTIPGGGAGWLGVEERGGQLQASLLWGGGSVLPLDSARVEDGKLVLTRVHAIERKDAAGKAVKTQITETITATANGDDLKLTSVKPKANGAGEDKSEFVGQRQPPLPPAPDLSKVPFGAPVPLFNGQDLSGWRLVESGAVSGWSAKDGVLVNAALITTIGFILSCTLCYVLAVQGLRRSQGQRSATPRLIAIDVASGFSISAPVFWMFTQFLAINLPGLTDTGWI